MGARRLLRRIAYLVNRRRHDEELGEELRHHHALAQERLERGGLSADEAASAARRRMGNVAAVREYARDAWGWTWLQDLCQDIRLAVRMLTRDLRFTVAVVMALGLAIGLNNSVFTVINTALLRDVPFEQPHRLLDLALLDANGREAGLSYADYRHWSDAQTLEGVSVSSDSIMNLGEDGRPAIRLRGAFVTANTFGLLRSAPIVGRDFRPEDDVPGAPAVAILGDTIWQNRYDGDHGVIGRTVRINGIPATIIGVMPQSFAYPFIAEVWQPLAGWPGLERDRSTARPFRNVIARLAEAADVPAAQAEIAGIAAAAPAAADGSASLRPHVRPMRESIGGRQAEAILMTFMGAVALVLLIACANVANLLLARAMTRSREIAVRAALGATRWRIVRQLLMEALVLAVLACAVGLVLSFSGARALAVGFSIVEPGVAAGEIMPFWVNLSPDKFVLAFLGTACLTSTLAFGLVPALLLARTNVIGALKEGDRGALAGRRARLWTSTFIVAEIALTVILLAGAGLLWRSFFAHYRHDLVVDTGGLVTARFTPGAANDGPEVRLQLVKRLVAGLERAFGADDFAFASQAPPMPGGAAHRLIVDGGRVSPGAPQPAVSVVYVGLRYFETLGIVINGNDATDRADVAVVDARFAAIHFQGSSPIGRRFRVVSERSTDSRWWTVAGIVPAVPDFGPPPLRHPVVYLPLQAGLASTGDLSVVVRSRAPLAIVAASLREEVRQVASDSPLYALEPVADAAARGRSGQRLAGTIFGAIALVGLVLSTVGVYALTAYGVSQRTREIGLRVALGARPLQVVWLFLGRTAVLFAIGVTFGTVGALATGRLLQSFLVEVGPRDPLTLAAVAVVLGATAVIACLIPSRRASRLDPMTALRVE
jgi:putative ABC transport system permease protein